MIFKNLRRRKGRTFLTVLGISVGVAAIVALGALADGIQAGSGLPETVDPQNCQGQHTGRQQTRRQEHLRAQGGIS